MFQVGDLYAQPVQSMHILAYFNLYYSITKTRLFKYIENFTSKKLKIFW